MRQTSNQYVTVFDTTIGQPVSVPAHPIAAPDRGYRVVIAACLALAVVGLTTAAGAFAHSQKHSATSGQPTYSATFVKLPTGASFEDALY
jgi:hypothetical protein